MALQGLWVLELAGLVPMLLCGMIQADHSARVERLALAPVPDVQGCGKYSLPLDLKRSLNLTVPSFPKL